MNVSSAPVLGCRRRELGHQRFEVAFGVRERFRAAVVFCTAFDQEIERTLRVSSHIHAEHFRRRSDAIQDDAPHATGELARVADGGAGPVGDAIKVDALVSERIAHVVEIFHRDCRRIEAGVRVELLEALCDPRLHRFVLEQPKLADVVGLGTSKWVRRTRASLVDEHDVTFAVDAHEGALHADVAFRCGLSRAAGEKHERVGLGIPADRGHDGDAEIDRAAGTFITILVDGERAALRGGAGGTSVGAQLARREREASFTTRILWRMTAPEHQEGIRDDLTHPACAR